MASPAAEHVMGGGGVMGGATGDVPGTAGTPSDALMAMCLAVAETAALALGALALASALAALLGSLLSGRLRLWPLVLAPRVALAPRARPPDLSVLQVFQR